MIGKKPRMRWSGLGQNCTSFWGASGPFASDQNCGFFATLPTPHPTGPSTAANYPGLPPVQAPLPVVGPTAEQLAQGASWTPEQALAATQQAQRIANIQFFQNITTPPPSGVDCTNTWTYLTNSGCPVDCTNFFSNLFNSSCPGYLGSSLAMPLAIAAGVLLLVVVIRR